MADRDPTSLSSAEAESVMSYDPRKDLIAASVEGMAAAHAIQFLTDTILAFEGEIGAKIIARDRLAGAVEKAALRLEEVRNG